MEHLELRAVQSHGVEDAAFVVRRVIEVHRPRPGRPASGMPDATSPAARRSSMVKTTGGPG
ncbi:MAG: hypothetical protein LJE68_15685 [Rhodobacter sp.]|nr:hypothetical protein [Rhodobacter sp.]